MNIGRIKALGVIIFGCLFISNPLLSQYVHPFDHFSTPKNIFSESKTLDWETIKSPVPNDEQTIVIGIIPRLFSLNSAMQNSLSTLTRSDTIPFAEVLDLVDLSLSETNNQDQFNPLPLLTKPEQPPSKPDGYSRESAQNRQILSFCDTFSKLHFNDSQSFDCYEDYSQNSSFVSSYSLGSFFSFLDPLSLVHSPRFYDSSLEQLPPNPNTRPPNSETAITSDPKVRIFNDYPDFTRTKDPSMLLTYNVFEQSFENTPNSVNTVGSDLSESDSLDPTYVRSTRQRRIAWSEVSTYTWEINDFDPTNTSLNPIGTSDNNLTEFSTQPGNKAVKLNIVANDGIDSLSVLAYGTTGGNAFNDYSETNGFHFMTATGYTGSTGDVSDDFNITIYGEGGGTGIGEWLNGYDSNAAWGVHYDGNNDFYLTYEFSNLNFSPVPEPSTYFMTGILFCFIGCNRSSRNTIKTFLSKVFMHWKTKDKIEDVQNRIS